jgi:hypothetical protein
MPCDSLDEFARKPIRNDYLFQALEELGIRKLRIPVGDLGDQETVERIRVLKRLGYEFSVFSVGVPADPDKDQVVEHQDLVDAWEVTVPRSQIEEAIAALREAKTRAAVAIFLSTLDTLADQKEEEDFVFSHFPSHGFKLREFALLKSVIDRYDAADVLDGFVFSVNAEMEILESIRAVEEIMNRLSMRGLVHLNMPRRTEAIPFVDDDEIARVTAETVVASLAVENVDVFLDTLVDHDRGYFPRNGLMDRRNNPRLAYHTFRHLYRAVSGFGERLTAERIKTDPEIRAFDLRSTGFRSVLILPEAGRGPVDLEFDAELEMVETDLRSLDLHTGRVRGFDGRVLGAGTIRLDPETESSAPSLLILDQAELGGR